MHLGRVQLLVQGEHLHTQAGKRGKVLGYLVTAATGHTHLSVVHHAGLVLAPVVHSSHPHHLHHMTITSSCVGLKN